MADDQPTTKKKQLDNKTFIWEANAFSIALVTNSDLLDNYLTTLSKAIADKHNTVQIMDNYIAHKTENKVRDYDTTFEYVLQSQQTLPTYMLVYWSGVYDTKIKPDSGTDFKDGLPFTIMATTDPDQPYTISYGDDLIIDATFKDLVLQWDTTDGLNGTSGLLQFNVLPTKKGSNKSFSGTYTDANGDKNVLTGLMVGTPDSAPQGVPPEVDAGWRDFSRVMMVVGAVSQALLAGYVVYKIVQWRRSAAAASRAGYEEAAVRARARARGYQEIGNELEPVTTQRQVRLREAGDVPLLRGGNRRDIEEAVNSSDALRAARSARTLSRQQQRQADNAIEEEARVRDAEPVNVNGSSSGSTEEEEDDNPLLQPQEEEL